ncbi:MAG TPA: outer membrane beta-barrel domain-containing protein [Anaeromyxobacteraceae bacterium]|nr:outer membrane beta-barrel domain-containing protein [Anaeromyxobacteraceae bacterium]
MRAILWLALALPLAAAAQQVPGIDLSAPPEEKPAEPPPPAEKTRVPPQELGTPKKEAARPGDALEAAVGVPGERDTALEDRVKAVQRKGFLKRGRLQLTALVSPTWNDAFYQKLGLSGRLAYNLRDSFAVAVSGSYYLVTRTDYVKQGVRAFNSQLLQSQPTSSVMLEGVWSPIYGKAAWLGRSIVHFDFYLVGGLGAVWSATSFEPRNEGAHLAAEFGGGLRFYPLSYLALELAVTGAVYPDQKDLAVPGTLQKIITAGFGVSFLWPTGFEYYYP